MDNLRSASSSCCCRSLMMFSLSSSAFACSLFIRASSSCIISISWLNCERYLSFSRVMSLVSWIVSISICLKASLLLSTCFFNAALSLLNSLVLWSACSSSAFISSTSICIWLGVRPSSPLSILSFSDLTWEPRNSLSCSSVRRFLSDFASSSLRLSLSATRRVFLFCSFSSSSMNCGSRRTTRFWLGIMVGDDGLASVLGAWPSYKMPMASLCWARAARS
mmetsp:Transcript_22434/g.62200  ORF Transcript_22434/g.62200 Transcript_22434/m.62200 type:complete len:221 (+) Transcript_22434:2206-2868(+)